MEYLSYWQSLTPEQKTALATRLGTSKTYLSHLGHGHRSPSVFLRELLTIITGEALAFPHDEKRGAKKRVPA